MSPTDKCEYATVPGEIVLDAKTDLTFAPLYSFFAVLAAAPLMFLFDLAVIYLQKMPIIQESSYQNFKILVF